MREPSAHTRRSTFNQGGPPMNQRTVFELAPFSSGERRSPRAGGGGMFEQQFIQQLLTAVRPEIKALIKEVIAAEGGEPLIVDYEEAGRMIGTTYEGVRKLVRKGKLTAVSRSGRRSEERSVGKECRSRWSPYH